MPLQPNQRKLLNKWAEVLDSGAYKQTRNALQDDKGYCCLGVLCDLHAKKFGLQWDIHDDERLYCGYTSTLPSNVMTWAGVSNHGGYVVVNKLSPGMKAYLTRKTASKRNVYSLVALNDKDVPFKTISKLIKSKAFTQQLPE